MIKCLICEKVCKNYTSLALHIHIHNLTSKEYYDKHIKTEQDGKCLVCGGETKFDRLSSGYRRCCSKCFQKSPLKKIHSQQTNKERYGVTCNLQIKEVREKVKNNCIEKHGTDCYFKSKECKEKEHQYLEKLVTQYNLTHNDKLTNVTNIGQIPEIKDKIKKSIQNRTIEQNELTNEKRRKTCVIKYGAEHWTKNKEWLSNFQQEYFNKTGYYNPQQNPTIFNKRFSKYCYETVYFDSSWELAYYIWLKDNNIEFEYHSGVYFEYKIGNKIKKYYPDFILKDRIIEIKSDYLLNNNCKYRIPDEKMVCMKEHNVIIMCKSEMKPFLDYISNKYGRNFLKEHKIQNKV